MAYPPVVIVNEQDEVVGEAQLDDARARGLIYRLVFVSAKDDQGRVLLQKRSNLVKLYPNCWDLSAGGHVDDGHTYQQAAELETSEELGISGLALEQIAHFYSDKPLWGNMAAKRFITIFSATLNQLPDKLEAEEVAEVRWFTLDEINQLVSEHPDQLGEGLQEAYNRHCL